MKTFVVDNDSKDETARAAIRDLKRMVRYGKLAERALGDIKTKGSHEGRVCVVHKDHYLSAVVHRYPAFQPVSRSDLPDWAGLTVVCGEVEKGAYGGSTFAKMPVYVDGRGLCHARESNTGNHPTGKLTSRVVKTKLRLGQNFARLGFCRLKSNGEVTFETDHRWNHLVGKVFRIKRNVEASDKTRLEAAVFAKIYAHALVYCGENYEYGGKENVSQKMLDLREAVPGWLMEDGMIARMFGDMLDSIDVSRVFGA